MLHWMQRWQPSGSGILFALTWGALFGLAYGQSPLYTSNQNQYFLHGLAQSGVGLLREDWLANTIDPTPVFTGLVRFGSRFADGGLFYVFFLLLLGVYLSALFGIADSLFALRASQQKALLFYGILFVLHSAALRVALAQGVSGEWAYLFDGGVAGQRLLGTVLQPSVFGVFLLLAVHLFLRGQAFWAAAAAATAALVHPTYLVGAGVLVLCFGLMMHRHNRSLRGAIALGALSLLLVLPILIYVARSFIPASSEAQNILVHFRLPAHALPAEWFDATVLVKTGLILSAIALTRGSKLSLLMLLISGFAVTLTAAQVLTQSEALALLFPWRLSTLLVPLASAVIAARLAAAIANGSSAAPRTARSILIPVSLVAAGASVGSGILWSALQFTQQRQAPEREALIYVAQHVRSGELYMIPPKLQDFRLATGAPALADFKSIPYRSGEVLAWYDRLRFELWFYRDPVDCGLLDTAATEYGVTHVVLDPDHRPSACRELKPLHDDGRYAVMSLEVARP